MAVSKLLTYTRCPSYSRDDLAAGLFPLFGSHSTCKSFLTIALVKMSLHRDGGILKATENRLPFFTHENEGKWKGDFYFIQAADTQLGLIERYLEHRPNPKWDKEVELSHQLVEKVNKMNPKPKFLIVCGDMIDAYPTWADRKPQERDFFDIFKQLHPDIPLLCVCGNHDVGEKPTGGALQQYGSSFGDDYYSFWVSGVRFTVANAQYWKDASDVLNERDVFENWINETFRDEEVLARGEARPRTLMFQHVPFFIDDVNEESTDKSEYFHIRKDLRLELLDRFEREGVQKVFCGHLHRNAGGWYKGLELVTTTAVGAQLGKDTHGFRVVKVTQDAIAHKFCPLNAAPTKLDEIAFR